MGKFKVRYIRAVTEIYEAEIEAEDEDKAMEIIWGDKYGNGIKGEKLIEKYSDEIEIDEVEEIEL